MDVIAFCLTVHQFPNLSPHELGDPVNRQDRLVMG